MPPELRPMVQLDGYIKDMYYILWRKYCSLAGECAGNQEVSNGEVQTGSYSDESYRQ